MSVLKGGYINYATNTIQEPRNLFRYTTLNPNINPSGFYNIGYSPYYDIRNDPDWADLYNQNPTYTYNTCGFPGVPVYTTPDSNSLNYWGVDIIRVDPLKATKTINDLTLTAVFQLFSRTANYYIYNFSYSIAITTEDNWYYRDNWIVTMRNDKEIRKDYYINLPIKTAIDRVVDGDWLGAIPSESFDRNENFTDANIYISKIGTNPLTFYDSTVTVSNIYSKLKSYTETFLKNKILNQDTNYSQFCVIVAHIANLIKRKVPDITKTYTNSTWNTSKKWYIKVTFSKNSSDYHDLANINNNRNVVNYETMIQKHKVLLKSL